MSWSLYSHPTRRVGWKVHRLTMMHWSNLTKCGLFFTSNLPCFPHFSSIGVAALDSRGIEADPRISPQLLVSSTVRYCFPCSKVSFSRWGSENSQIVPNQENMDVNQPVQSHSCAQQPLQPQTCVQEHCPGETGLHSSVFQAISEMSLVLHFKVLNYLSSVGLSGRKPCS